MGLEIEYIDGQTPLSEEEKEGLLIPVITTQKELNELMADILVENAFNQKAFNWGSENLSDDGVNRKLYLNAIKAADKNDYKQLLNFARS